MSLNSAAMPRVAMRVILSIIILFGLNCSTGPIRSAAHAIPVDFRNFVGGN
nr:MAG TPA: hypothetical protein [Caudoviricetes sp.]